MSCDFFFFSSLFEELLGSHTHLDSHTGSNTYRLLDLETLDLILVLGCLICGMEVVTHTSHEVCKDKR